MRPMTMALVVALVMMLVPPTEAAETVVEDYAGALGASAQGVHYATIVNPPNDFSPVPGPTIAPIGGVHLYPSTLYNALLAAPSDDVYGGDAAIATCFWGVLSDDTCDPQQDGPSPPGCGPALLMAPGWQGAKATVWIFSILVEEDLTSCGGSIGMITGDFFHV